MKIKDLTFEVSKLKEEKLRLQTDSKSNEEEIKKLQAKHSEELKRIQSKLETQL